jgi:hypothetical protein
MNRTFERGDPFPAPPRNPNTVDGINSDTENPLSSENNQLPPRVQEAIGAEPNMPWCGYDPDDATIANTYLASDRTTKCILDGLYDGSRYRVRVRLLCHDDYLSMQIDDSMEIYALNYLKQTQQNPEPPDPPTLRGISPEVETTLVKAPDVQVRVPETATKVNPLMIILVMDQQVGENTRLQNLQKSLRLTRDYQSSRNIILVGTLRN